MATDAPLPIEPVLGPVCDALADAGLCVLQAPPGAGKTTRVPLAVLEAGVCAGRILMLEPRRVAARGAAERLAEGLAEHPGGRVGYRMRGDSVAGSRIEVVTEGILTRMIQSDPELSGIGCVIFDEFHERSLQADLGLALCLEIRAALRPDLRLLVMSATLDAAPVAALMGDAPVITSRGRSYPVETRWLAQPLPRGTRSRFALEDAVVARTLDALAETAGGVLVFLPGRAEIARVGAALRPRIGPDVRLMELHGGLAFKAQRQVLAPLAEGRKLVLSTAIAETSVTLPDIRVVVDGGQARRARFDPGSGMTRLVTERVTKAEAEQRRGRAGRVAPGTCYRLWTMGEEGGMIAFPPPEIAAADLAPLALELALWGVRDPAGLAFLTPPPEGSYAAARDLLHDLGALDAAGALTDMGRRIAAVPVHPRLAHMLLAGGGKTAVALAALIEGRDIVTGGGQGRPPADLTLRLEALADPSKFEGERPFRADRAARADVVQNARRLARMAGPDTGLSAGAVLSLAYPDRIALRRPGDAPRYLLSGGAGALLDPADPLAGQRMLVAADLDGDRREARIRLALPVTEAEMKAVHADRTGWRTTCTWSRRHRRIEARAQLMLGALVLDDRHWREVTDADAIPALLEGLRDLGATALPWSAAARAFQARVGWLRARGSDLPALDDDALLDGAHDWLAPWMAGMRDIGDLGRLDLLAVLRQCLSRDALALVDRLAPSHLVAPTGSRLLVDYSGDAPAVSVRLQEMFGLAVHPVLGPDRVPVVVHLMSPAGRPVQTTADLPRFWATSYGDVRKDMRGRYPRHPWPEDPLAAAPTRRVKPAAGGET